MFPEKEDIQKKNDRRTIKSSVFCKKASQICFIRALKESRYITMIAREKKRGLCWHPFAGKYDCKDMGKVS